MIVNGRPLPVTTPRNVVQLLEELSIEPRGIAVAINGEIARRSQWDLTMVQPGDTVEIVTAVAGG